MNGLERDTAGHRTVADDGDDVARLRRVRGASPP